MPAKADILLMEFLCSTGKTYRKFPEIQGKILSAELFALELVLIEEFWGFWRQQQLSNWGKFPVPTRQTEANK